MAGWKRAAWWLLGGVVLCALPTLVLQHALQRGFFHAKLTGALSEAFGRPVQVDRFRWVPWDANGIEAENVTVAEFPAFGQEYFLRAERVVIHFRWTSLLGRRFQATAVGLDRPSLNLVRAGGKWNVETWLGGLSSDRSSAEHTPPVERLEIHDGRINFKHGLDKLPFALIGVNGWVHRERPGRWTVHLQAAPMRAGVSLQDVGDLELSGEVGARSQRLFPLQVRLRWSDASISDLGRLLLGQDPGVRGRAALEAHLEAQPGNWQFTLRADARGLHRWDLPPRSDNPALLVQVKGTWDPATNVLRFASGQIEAPQSQARLSGEMHQAASGRWVPSLDFDPVTLSLADVLRAYRAFHPGVDEQVSASGWIHGGMRLSDWPLRPDDAQWSAQHLVLQGPGGVFQVRSLNVSSRDGRGKLSVEGIGPQGRPGELQLQGRFACPRDCKWTLTLQGHDQQVGALRSTATALGWPVAPWWRGLEGAGKVFAQWQGHETHVADWKAVFDLQQARWQVAALPSPITASGVKVQAAPHRLRIVLQRGRVFGAEWGGWLERRTGDSGSPWHFDLHADRLDWSALRAGTEMRTRRSWFERLFGASSPKDSALLWLRNTNARGSVRIAHFRFGKVELQQLRGEVRTGGSGLAISELQSRLGNGRLEGSFALTPRSDAVRWNLSFRGSGLQLDSLVPASGMPARLKGTLSVAGTLSADSTDPQRSLNGKLHLVVVQLADNHTDWLASLRSGRAVPGRTFFARAEGSLVFSQGQVMLRECELLAAGRRWVAEGTAALNPPGRFSLQLSVVSARGRGDHGPGALEPLPYQLAGTMVPWSVVLRPVGRR